MTKLIITVVAVSLLSGCSETNTTDPIDSYKYWAGTKPPTDLEVIQGKYWQSAHWTKEYIVYLKIKPTAEWWNAFVSQNKLAVDKGQWTVPTGSPEWFKLPDNVTLYRPENDFYDSRFFRDNQKGECLSSLHS